MSFLSFVLGSWSEKSGRGGGEGFSQTRGSSIKASKLQRNSLDLDPSIDIFLQPCHACDKHVLFVCFVLGGGGLRGEPL